MRVTHLFLPLGLLSCTFLSGVFRVACGDGFLDAKTNEQCDDGNEDDTDSCLHTCQLASCGDGIVQVGVEGCDDANTIDNDGCSSDCVDETLCGNGVLNTGEECDDGNNNDADSCLPTCQDAACGDGIVHAGVEQCDDGNQVAGDGCRNDCSEEVCGDGIVDPNLVCLALTPLPAQAAPSRLAAADLDSDGDLDIAVSSNNPPQLQVYLNQGNGLLASQSPLVIGGNASAGGMTIADLDDDNLPDIAATFNPAANPGLLVVAVHSSQTNFVLTAISPIAVGTTTREMLADDFSGGSTPDLFIAVLGENRIAEFENPGDGVAFSPGANLLTGVSPFGLVAVDLDGDGLQDLVAADSGATTASLFTRSSRSSFQPPVTAELGAQCLFIVAGDFNNDARPDLAATGFGGGQLSVILQNSNGTFGAPALFDLSSPSALGVGDFNTDGQLDLAVVNQLAAGTVSLMLGDGLGDFTAGPVLAAGNAPTSMAIGDFNGDSSPDFIVTNLGDNTLSLYLSNP